MGFHPSAIMGSSLKVALGHVRIGELCDVLDQASASAPCLQGLVTSVHESTCTVSLLGDASGLSVEAIVVPTGALASIRMSRAVLGSVLDGFGRVIETIHPSAMAEASVLLPVAGEPPAYHQRRSIDEIFHTGIRSIDALLTCGVGQRMGIFAGAGAGKTTLVEMLLTHSSADVFVIALVGERGREVAGFIERVRRLGLAERTVVVQATSDQAPAIRANAAMLATTVAEYFRDTGQRVLLVLDSITRYARALRDMALAAGELPARRGFPASVFENLPRLVERPGKTEQGSITAFYTVLLEDEDSGDSVGEEVKSLLDGHIYLSPTLASRGHYPAVDVLKSGSRLFNLLADAGQQACARKLRSMLGTLEDLKVMRELGEYRKGENAEYDLVINRESAIHTLLQQGRDESAVFGKTLEMLHAVAH